MEKVASARIRKIQWGIIPGLPTQIHQVGSKVAGKDQYVIHEIIEDTNTVFSLGHYEYLIYIKLVGVKDSDPVLWQRYIKAPDKVEYYFDGENEAFI